MEWTRDLDFAAAIRPLFAALSSKGPATLLTAEARALQAAVRDLAAAHRACEDDLARAEETGQIARLDLPILRAEAWDRLMKLAGVEP